jgi:succinoglycan biosynthesis protein ExoO
VTGAEQSAGPAATVAVPVYNSAGTLRRCLDSVSAQSLRDIEILVVDDASTDNSAGIAAECAHADPRIRLIRLERNGGKSAAMNLMVDQARGRWIAVLDADDAFHKDRLQSMTAAAEAAGVEMAADNIVFLDSGAREIVRTAFASDRPPFVVGRPEFLRNSNSYSDFDFGILKPIVRRDFLLRHQIRYYEKTRMAEDFYYLMMIFLRGGRGIIVPNSFYYWTMPFGPVSRRWTTTGSGAWRYDYRPALAANEHFEAVVREAGDRAFEALLRRRSRQYRVMISYLAAQRAASEGRWHACAGELLRQPATFGLLARRIAGRIRRGWSRQNRTQHRTADHHAAMRSLGSSVE